MNVTIVIIFMKNFSNFEYVVGHDDLKRRWLPTLSKRCICIYRVSRSFLIAVTTVSSCALHRISDCNTYRLSTSSRYRFLAPSLPVVLYTSWMLLPNWRSVAQVGDPIPDSLALPWFRRFRFSAYCTTLLQDPLPFSVWSLLVISRDPLGAEE